MLPPTVQVAWALEGALRDLGLKGARPGPCVVTFRHRDCVVLAAALASDGTLGTGATLVEHSAACTWKCPPEFEADLRADLERRAPWIDRDEASGLPAVL